jgi:PPOX class probable F420-dependent enzyme
LDRLSIPESHRDLLQSTALAYLATIGPKGEPQVSAVWFNWDGTHVTFALSNKRQKTRNLIRDPHVALALADPANPYRSLEIRGIVTHIDPDTDYRAANAASQKYTQRNMSADELGRPEDRVVVVVEPQHVLTFPPPVAKQ